MANRDLLHKPIPLGAPDDAASESKLPAAPGLNKLGVQNRAREIGGEGPVLPVSQAPEVAPVNPVSRRAPASPHAPQARTPAFRAAYFNRDVESTGAVNQRAHSMKALRGDEGASDLRKIVIPPPSGAEIPDPQTLQSALSLMADGDVHALDLGSLLARQGSWSKSKGVTAEMIGQRLAQLKQMVQDRVAALRRMAHLSPQGLMRSATLAQAATSEGRGHEDHDDLGAAGRDLVQSTAAQAAGMHTRLAKALGHKGR